MLKIYKILIEILYLIFFIKLFLSYKKNINLKLLLVILFKDILFKIFVQLKDSTSINY
jgi:hypothetical protein